MDVGETAKIVWALAILVFIVVVYRSAHRRGRRPSIGPGAMGSVYDLLNQDKRNAIELIVEEKAEARDPEDADGNLPDLEDPRRASKAPSRR
jgi:hypothetical protein